MTSPPFMAAASEADPVVADILTAAFTGDPLMAWIFRDPDTHVESMSVWWHWLMAHGMERASIWRIDERAAAIWQPPVLEVVDAPERDRGPFIDMITPLVGDRVGSILEMFRLIGEGRPPDPYWYLSAVGSIPEVQGQGLGASVLEPALEKCDTEGLPAYLESSNALNLPFYHRLGFEISGEIAGPGKEVILTKMWREPR